VVASSPYPARSSFLHPARIFYYLGEDAIR
jgi:hypothetical protein